MEYKLYVQDPTSADTTYLFEAIVESVRKATDWQGIYAFASRAAVDTLIADPDVQEFLKRGTCLLVVGIDAVTNRATLERLKELESQYPNLSARVFWNETDRLFHPKASMFRYKGGACRLVVGSGNLTPGGLQEHFEAFSVLSATPNDNIDIASWERFFTVHAGTVRPIDEAALERAAKNKVVRRQGGAHKRGENDVEPEPGPAPPEAEEPETPPPSGNSQALVACVPRGGGRWHQVHFNKDVIKRFFQVKANSPQRVFLSNKGAGAQNAEQEVRPCIYSKVNKNYKLELAAGREKLYPRNGVPVVVFVKVQTRTFQYLMLFPGDPGFAEMYDLTQTLPNLGRGHRRVITTAENLRRVWPECPL